MKRSGRFKYLWVVAATVLYLALMQLVLPNFWRSGPGFADADSQLGRLPSALLVVVVGAATTSVVLYLTRNVGKNEVYGTTAVEAATPRADQGNATTRTRLVSDAQLAAMATTTFAPPTELRPWQGHVLLREVVDRRTADSFVAGLIADEALVVVHSPSGDGVLTFGPRFDRVSDIEQQWARRLLGADDAASITSFDRDYALGMRELAKDLRDAVTASGWWRPNHGPSVVTSNASAADETANRMLLVIPAVLILVMVPLFSGFLFWPIVLAVVTAVLSALMTAVALMPSMSARTAEGSAYALQVESFRRFLDGSETAHVEHAWDSARVREYGAWAIAIDEAAAWRPVVARAENPSVADVLGLLTEGNLGDRRRPS